MDRTDVEHHYTMMPNPQTVQVHRRNPRTDEIEKSFTVEYVEQRDLTKKEGTSPKIPANTETTKFHLWVANMAGEMIQTNDIIQHGSEWWSVVEAPLEMMRTRYRCICAKSSEEFT